MQTIYLKHPMTGVRKQSKVGWSWTGFLFGFWVPLFRGDWKWAAISFGVQFVLGLFSFGISSLVWCCVLGAKYNQMYVEGLIDRGYVRVDEATYWTPMATFGVPVTPATEIEGAETSP
jgi:hypothetical protein